MLNLWHEVSREQVKARDINRTGKSKRHEQNTDSREIKYERIKTNL
jgi:hypothetical protein